MYFQYGNVQNDLFTRVSPLQATLHYNCHCQLIQNCVCWCLRSVGFEPRTLPIITFCSVSFIITGISRSHMVNKTKTYFFSADSQKSTFGMFFFFIFYFENSFVKTNLIYFWFSLVLFLLLLYRKSSFFFIERLKEKNDCIERTQDFLRLRLRWWDFFKRWAKKTFLLLFCFRKDWERKVV